MSYMNIPIDSKAQDTGSKPDSFCAITQEFVVPIVYNHEVSLNGQDNSTQQMSLDKLTLFGYYQNLESMYTNQVKPKANKSRQFGF